MKSSVTWLISGIIFEFEHYCCLICEVFGKCILYPLPNLSSASISVVHLEHAKISVIFILFILESGGLVKIDERRNMANSGVHLIFPPFTREKLRFYQPS